MDVPLSPLEFARRARRLYADREAVVDGALRLTYRQFFDRVDRWSSALRAIGVAPGDRVAYIAPNTHAQLESFYAVPQIGAVLVPVNYRLTADDFAYLIDHSGAVVVCAHADYLESVDRVRSELPGVRTFVALEGAREGWLEYESTLAAASPEVEVASVSEGDLLTINYTSGTTTRPKGVMITHRNAYINTVGTLVHHPMSSADRYLWTLPMFHANGWTFVWTVTAVGATHVCVRNDGPRVDLDVLRRADRPDWPRQRAAGTARPLAPWCPPPDRRGPAGARHDRPRGGRIGLGRHPRLRPDGNIPVHHGLRAAPGTRSNVAARPRRDQGSPGGRAGHVG
jgi:fatty-acyl-CoA synthase